jgi:hypothetical protein
MRLAEVARREYEDLDRVSRQPQLSSTCRVHKEEQFLRYRRRMHLLVGIASSRLNLGVVLPTSPLPKLQLEASMVDAGVTKVGSGPGGITSGRWVYPFRSSSFPIGKSTRFPPTFESGFIHSIECPVSCFQAERME